MKRLFLLFFSALLCTAVSAHDFVVDGIFYDITSSSELTVAVTYGGSRYDSYSNEYSGSVFIPEKVTYHSNEYSVTSIGYSAFEDCSYLTSVTIPNSVTSIEGAAFRDCSGLTSVTIGNSVTSIGYSAFDGCSDLTSVTIPNSVTSIGDWAFCNCYGLTSVTIGNSVTSIGNYAFRDCSGLTSVTIPNSVTSIGDEAFRDCYGLTSVTIGNSVTSIGDEAFRDCYGLTSVTIGNSVTSIGEIAFKGCSALTAVHITDLSAWCKIQFVKDDYYGEYSNPTFYADHLYLNGEEITNLVIPDDVTSIGNAAFRGCSGLTSVTIPNSVTSIGEEAFYKCSGLTSVTIGNSVTSIGSRAFYGTGWYNEHSNGILYLDSWLIGYRDKPTGTLEIKEGTRGIANNAFSGCSGMTSVTIPNSVTSIGNEAFSYCYGLTSVTIPNSVTSIGNYAFRDCSGLTSVTIPNSVTSIGNYAFRDCSGLTAVHITDLSAWCKIKFDNYESNPTSCAHHLYLNGEEITNLVIPDDVTSIGYRAFSGCSGLTSVTIPNSVTSIGNYAFYECSVLTNVTIGNSVTSIGENAFQNCSALTNVTIGNSVNSIGSGAFSGCSGLTSVTIPNSVTSIEWYAFCNCSGLTSVTIPNSVTSIGELAFKGCSALTAVHITDLSAWCKIQFVKDDYYGEYSNPTLYANHLYLNGEEITNLVIPDDVTSIGDAAFIGCSGLTSVTIPNSVTSIGTYAFADCYGLTSVTIPESCKIVPQYAFEWCINLQELTLPSTCIACYDYSFNECSSLKKINCQAETPPAVYANTFSSNIYTMATLNVPEGSVDKYKAANIWKKFTNMTTGGVVPDEPKQCAAPVITYADGKLQFACETEGAECKYTLTAKDIQTAFITASNNSVDLTACYDITAYAVAEGYKNSEKMTATLYWINGSDVSTNINQTEMRGVMATCSGGIITVSGLSDGETVMFYDANGALLYTGTAQNGTISYAPSVSGVIIVKIGTVSIKVVS